jgi:hypothetical protein
MTTRPAAEVDPDILCDAKTRSVVALAVEGLRPVDP